MSWALIELCDELKARVENAVTNGGLACKDVFIGDFEQIRKPNDYPICVISPLSFKVNAVCMRHGVNEESELAIVYIASKLAENDNKLYKNGDSTGMLYELAKLLNYLEKKTSDSSVDLTVNGKTYNLAVPNISFDYSANDIIKVMIRYSVQTSKFQRGTR